MRHIIIYIPIPTPLIQYVVYNGSARCTSTVVVVFNKKKKKRSERNVGEGAVKI